MGSPPSATSSLAASPRRDPPRRSTGDSQPIPAITVEAAVTQLLHQDLQERARGMKLATKDEAAKNEGLRQPDSDKQLIDADRLTEIAAALPPSLAPLAGSRSSRRRFSR
jgi:hypothetical protein